MADAPDSKSGGGNPVGVQVPPPAPNKNKDLAIQQALSGLLFFADFN